MFNFFVCWTHQNYQDFIFLHPWTPCTLSCFQFVLTLSIEFFILYQFVLCFSCSFFFLHNLFTFILHSQFSLSYAPSFYEHYVFLYFLDLWLFAPLCYISVLSFLCNCSCTLVLQKHYILVIISSISTMFFCIASTYNYLHLFFICKQFLFIGFVCTLCCICLSCKCLVLVYVFQSLNSISKKMFNSVIFVFP
jgi:hypothetical protein